MSYEIEYRYSPRLIPGSKTGDGVDRYVILIESGSSNTYDTITNLRSRSWNAAYIGTHDEVMAVAVYVAGCCDDGHVRVNGKNVTAEAYIRKIRKLLSKPYVENDAPDGSPPFKFEYSCAIDSEHDQQLQTMGVCRRIDKKFWQESPHAYFNFDAEGDIAKFFQFFDSLPGRKYGGGFVTCR